MTEKEIVRLAEEAELWLHSDRKYEAVKKFAELVAAAEREAVLQAIEAVYTLEEDRNPMFSDGYKYALGQIETLIRARGQG